LFTILEKIRTKITIKGSHFISEAIPTSKEEEFTTNLIELKKEFYDASHHCFALRIGVDSLFQKYSDDGEPHGSAGKPIDMMFEKYSITNVAIVVVRYFGGTKLGVGGLVRAYSDSAEQSIIESKRIELLLVTSITIVCGYEVLSSIISIFEQLSVEHSYIMLEQCTVSYVLPTERMDFVQRLLIDIQHKLVSIKYKEPEYKAFNAK